MTDEALLMHTLEELRETKQQIQTDLDAHITVANSCFDHSTYSWLQNEIAYLRAKLTDTMREINRLQIEHSEMFRASRVENLNEAKPKSPILPDC